MLSFVGDPLALVGLSVPLVGAPVAPVGEQITPVGSTFAVRKLLSALLGVVGCVAIVPVLLAVRQRHVLILPPNEGRLWLAGKSSGEQFASPRASQ